MSEFVLSPDAEDELGEIWRFIFDESGEERADKFVDLLESKFELLSKFPEIGRRRDDYLVGLRSFPVKNYIVFYQPIANGIEVLHVLHASRDIESVFDRIIDEADKLN